jgi:uncharacterized damage-inducible protein DinB
MHGQIKKLTHNLETVFDGNPWYGIPIMKKLESIDWQLVNDRPSGSRSIAVLLQHMINWRIFVLKKLQGDTTYDIIIDGPNDWTEIHIGDKQGWDRLKKELQVTQKDLLDILNSASDALLVQKVPGKDYRFGPILDSVAQHDMYHLGQIALIDSMLKE